MLGLGLESASFFKHLIRPSQQGKCARGDLQGGMSHRRTCGAVVIAHVPPWTERASERAHRTNALQRQMQLQTADQWHDNDDGRRHGMRRPLLLLLLLTSQRLIDG